MQDGRIWGHAYLLAGNPDNTACLAIPVVILLAITTDYQRNPYVAGD